MRMTIQCESHTIELVFVILQEYRTRTLWYFDQPLAVKLNYKRPDGQPVTILHTTDYLTIQADRVVLTECKPREDYDELAHKHPGRYVLEPSGELRCPAAEAAAAELGFVYRIWSPSEEDQILATNLKFLADYYREDAPAVPEEVSQSIRAAVAKDQGTSIAALKAIQEAVNIDHVYAMVARVRGGVKMGQTGRFEIPVAYLIPSACKGTGVDCVGLVFCICLALLIPQSCLSCDSCGLGSRPSRHGGGGDPARPRQSCCRWQRSTATV